MTGDLARIEEIAGALLRQLAPPARRQLLRRLVRDLRASQSARIGRQQAPDGTPFPVRRPRRAQPDPTGRLRRKGALRRAAMFKKLRSARHLRSHVTDAEAWVGFTGRASRIAWVHQLGGEDRPSPEMKPVAYAKRELLGLTAAEEGRALDLLLDSVSTL